MPGVAPYVPAKDSAFDAWVTNFASLVGDDPSSYGLLATDAAIITGEVDGWSAAYAPCTSPATKTAAAVAAKNTARIVLTAQLRLYAQLVANNPGVSSASKIELGLNPKTSAPSPISAPASSPVLSIQSLGNLSAILRYRDSTASVSSKGKPYGVKSCQIFGVTSVTPIATPVALAPMLAQGTKSPLQVQFPGSYAGSIVYAWAYWVTQKGDKSPVSGIINFQVPTHS